MLLLVILLISSVHCHEVRPFSPTNHRRVCFEPIDPLIHDQFRRVPCTLAQSQGLAWTRSIPTAPLDNVLSFQLTCQTNNTVLCQKATDAHEVAGHLLANILRLRTTIRVNATLADFCTLGRECKDGRSPLLGGAAPARTFLLHDDDGMARIYPQALVKQLRATTHLSYASFDIMMLLNSEFSWWFDQDGPIQPDQYDYLYVVLHEVIHGLGFASAWSDYLNDGSAQALTPTPLPPSDWFTDNPTKSIKFNGFYENAFDRYLVELPSKQPLSNVTRLLDAFQDITNTTNHTDSDDPFDTTYFDLTQHKGNVSRIFNSREEFSIQFMSSPAYTFAQRMLRLATKPGRIGFMTLPKLPGGKGDIIPLETALPAFTVGSSLVHMDGMTFTSSADFLMRYQQLPGESVSETIKSAGDFVGGPFGPNLIRVLETLGYPINNRPVKIKAQVNGASVRTSWISHLVNVLS